jgi:DNA-binding CsgD family transcriptional regulator
MTRVGSLLCPVIVGRDEVLELFDHLVDEVGKGRGHTLFVSGQAGLGKTRLLRAAARKAVAAGVRVDGGDVAPQDREVPLSSILEMARGMASRPAFGTLGADLLALGASPDGDALGSRRRLVRAATDRILAAIDEPTVLVFDDLHWADEISLEVVGELARIRGDAPLLLLGGYRADEFPVGSTHREWRSRLLSQRLAVEARLERLTYEETAHATTLILGTGKPAPRDVVAAVHARTDGIPLHIEELLGALDERARKDGRLIREAHVPDTIEDAVLSRMERLSDGARAVARAGAVVGRCFVPEMLAGVMDRQLGELEPAFEELVEAAILYPFEYLDRGYYDFRHQLLRDAVYSTVSPTQLRRFHAQVAEFGTMLDGASVIHASRHFERAGLRPQAFRAALLGAEEASRISGRQEAYELYRRALDNMPDDLPIREQAELYERFSDAAGAIERNEDSRDAAREARRRYLEAGRPIDAAGILASLSVLEARQGASPERQIELVDEGLAELAALPASLDRDRLSALFLSMKGSIFIDVSDFEASQATISQSNAIAESLGDRETLLENHLSTTWMEISRGGIEEGLAEAFRASREARDAGFEAAGVGGFRNLALKATAVLDYETAERALAEGLRYADAIEQSHCRQMMAASTGLLAWTDGHWAEAEAIAQQELAERGCRRGETSALDVVALVAMGRGDLDEARARFEESLAAGRPMRTLTFVLPALWGLAETELLAGRTTIALGHVDEARTLATDTGERGLLIPFVVTGTRAWIEHKRPDEAERWLDWAREHLAGWGGARRPAEPALAHATGLIRLATGSVTAAREQLQAAVDGWQRVRRSWETAFARLDLASALLRANRFSEVSAHIAGVHGFADAAGSPLLRARADELARIARGRGAIEEPWRPLTAREFEVARLIAEGMTNAEIADRLTIAPKTASAHVEHILAKLQVNRRAEIAAWASIVLGPSGSGTSAGTALASRR